MAWRLCRKLLVMMAASCDVSWPWVGAGPRRLSPQEFFSQRIAVGRN